MKRNRAIALITNGILALVLIVVGVVCFFPSSQPVSGTESKAYYKGNSKTGVSLMINVYWGTEIVYRMMDVLEEHGATATFFLGGCWADDNVPCVKEIVSRGFEIGSHGYFHADHSKLGYEDNAQEIARSIEFLSLATGKTVELFAPPSGAFNADTLKAADVLGLKTVMWSKDTVDWRDKDETLCYRRATEGVSCGDLILMHPMEHTLKALPGILEYYAEAGLKTVTVGENLS